jgi:hypothetical protein
VYLLHVNLENSKKKKKKKTKIFGYVCTTNGKDVTGKFKLKNKSEWMVPVTVVVRDGHCDPSEFQSVITVKERLEKNIPWARLTITSRLPVAQALRLVTHLLPLQ